MNLSKKVLGEQLGVDAQTVARWEKAQTTISRLADVVLRALYLEIENKDSHITEMLAMHSEAEETDFSEKMTLKETENWKIAA